MKKMVEEFHDPENVQPLRSLIAQESQNLVRMLEDISAKDAREVSKPLVAV
jgi:hypothetical protein